jgi:hypothetical protein
MRNLARLLLFPKRSVRTSKHLIINKECYLYSQLKKEQNKYKVFQEKYLKDRFLSSFWVLRYLNCKRGLLMRNLARLLLFPKRSVRISEHLMINKECFLYFQLKKEEKRDKLLQEMYHKDRFCI